ncbi:MAG: hypothetical protein JST84_05475 [Acidobacteria bacterium]|nr:hypothetical protein [Acidobacteriota bacterium]
MANPFHNANSPPPLALDVTEAVFARMRERTPPADYQRFADPASYTQELKVPLLQLMIPSLLEEAVHLYERNSQRGIMLCDQTRPESRVLWVSVTQFAAALPAVTQEARREITELLTLYLPSETAVLVMMTAQAVQPLIVFPDGKLFSPGIYPLLPLPPAARGPQLQSDQELLAELATLHATLHRDDPPLASPEEEQVALVMAHLQQTVMELLEQEVNPQILELALFYQWLRLTTIVHGLSGIRFEELAAELQQVRAGLVHLLQQIESQLPDEYPMPQMAALGRKVQQLKDLAQTLATQPLERRVVEQQTDRTNRAFFALVQECLTQRYSPAFLEQGFLYYWLRLSTINANVSEVFFQKLEWHWPEVVRRVGMWVKQL